MNDQKVRDQLIDFASQLRQVIVFFTGRQGQPCISIGYVMRVLDRTVLLGFNIDDREPHALPIEVITRIEVAPDHRHD